MNAKPNTKKSPPGPPRSKMLLKIGQNNMYFFAEGFLGKGGRVASRWAWGGDTVGVNSNSYLSACR